MTLLIALTLGAALVESTLSASRYDDGNGTQSDPSWKTLYAHSYLSYANFSSTEQQFNAIFDNEAGNGSGPVIIRRECEDCPSPWDLIYVILRNKAVWENPYGSLLETWVRDDGERGTPRGFLTDFNLYSSFEDAQNGSNPWRYCNGGDYGVGFPRDCAPRSDQRGSYIWNSVMDSRSVNNYRFSVYRKEVHFLAWKTLYAQGSFPNVVSDEKEFNKIFEIVAGKGNGPVILRRECWDCPSPWDLIYVTLRNNTVWENPYSSLLECWVHDDGKTGTPRGFLKDFNLYSSFEDVQAGSNPWRYCNGGDYGVGFPRDCAPTSDQRGSYIWNSVVDSSSVKDSRFSILESLNDGPVIAPFSSSITSWWLVLFLPLLAAGLLLFVVVGALHCRKTVARSETRTPTAVLLGRTKLFVQTGSWKGQDKTQDPAWAAISLQQLEELREEAKQKLGGTYRTASMHDVNSAVIQPICNAHGKCYAHVVNAEQLLRLQVFVSHAWLENFDEFVEAILGAFSAWTLKPNIWICATALVQSTDPGVVALQVGIGKNPCDAPFTKALSQAEKVLVVRNHACDIYDRIWCCWELYHAYENGHVSRPGAFMVVGPSWGNGSKVVDVALAQASNLDDKRKILAYILQDTVRYEEVNRALMQVKFFGADPPHAPV